MSRGIEGEDHCCKKTQFIMEDVERAVKTGDFTGLSDKIFWRVYAAYQDGQMQMLIKQQESYREKAEKVREATRPISDSICDKCGVDIMAEETGPCTCHDTRETQGEATPPAV